MEFKEEQQKEIIKMKVEGMSVRAIAEKLTADSGTYVSEGQISRFCDKNEEVALKVAQNSGKLQKQIAETYFNTLQQLNELNAEMWNFWYELRKNPELQNKIEECPKCHAKISIKIAQYSNMLKAADSIMNQIRHVDSVLGKLQKRGVNITYNYVDLSKKLAVAIPELLKNTSPITIKKILNSAKRKYKEDRQEDDEEEELEEIEV